MTINKTTGRAKIRIVDSTGELLIESKLPAKYVDRIMLIGCQNWLDRVDPPLAAVDRTLRLVG